MLTQTRRSRRRQFSIESLETRQVLSSIFVSPTGSDTGPGTAEAPFRTLQKAANVAVAGDVVTARPGNYAGFQLGWDYLKSGAPNNPITFRGEPGAVIDTKNPKTLDGINIERGSWITIEGFTVINQGRAGIRVGNGDNIVVRNNVSSNNGKWGIFSTHVDDLLIEGNSTSGSLKEHGIYVSNSGDRPIIRKNIVFGNKGSGIHMNGDLSQGGDGIISNALIEGNTIYNNGYSGSGINMDGVQDSLIRNNLIYDSHSSGISLFKYNSAAPSINNTVVFNTIVNAADSKNAALNIKDGSTGTKIFNNILLTRRTTYATAISYSEDSLPGTISDFNVLSPNVNSWTSIAVWQSTYKQDRNSIVATPDTIGFVDASAKDFRLTATSQAVNTGISLTLNGVNLAPTYVGQRPDIGAFEYTPVIVQPSLTLVQKSRLVKKA